MRQAVREDDAAQRAPGRADLLVAGRAAQQQHHGLAAAAELARLQPLCLHQPPHGRACARRAPGPTTAVGFTSAACNPDPRACWP